LQLVPNYIILALAIANFLNKYPAQAKTYGNLMNFVLATKQKSIFKHILFFFTVAKLSEKLKEVFFKYFLSHIGVLLFLLHKLVGRENISRLS